MVPPKRPTVLWGQLAPKWASEGMRDGWARVTNGNA